PPMVRGTEARGSSAGATGQCPWACAHESRATRWHETWHLARDRSRSVAAEGPAACRSPLAPCFPVPPRSQSGPFRVCPFRWRPAWVAGGGQVAAGAARSNTERGPGGLIERARRGEQGALDRLLDSYRNYLRLLARTGVDATLRGQA